MYDCKIMLELFQEKNYCSRHVFSVIFLSRSDLLSSSQSCVPIAPFARIIGVVVEVTSPRPNIHVDDKRRRVMRMPMERSVIVWAFVPQKIPRILVNFKYHKFCTFAEGSSTRTV